MSKLRHNYSVYAYNDECNTCGKVRHVTYVVAVNSWDNVVEHVECYFCLLKSEKYAEEQERRMYEEDFCSMLTQTIFEENNLVEDGRSEDAILKDEGNI